MCFKPLCAKTSTKWHVLNINPVCLTKALISDSCVTLCAESFKKFQWVQAQHNLADRQVSMKRLINAFYSLFLKPGAGHCPLMSEDVTVGSAAAGDWCFPWFLFSLNLFPSTVWVAPKVIWKGHSRKQTFSCGLSVSLLSWNSPTTPTTSWLHVFTW